MDNLWIIYGSGWWYTYPSEKYESTGMIVPNTEKSKMFQTTNQLSLFDRFRLNLCEVNGATLARWANACRSVQLMVLRILTPEGLKGTREQRRSQMGT